MGAQGFGFFAGSVGARLGYPVHEVDQSVVINATVLAQADLAGTAGGDAFAAKLHRVIERAQGVRIELRGGEAFVAGKAAAVDALRDHHRVGAAPGEVDQCLAFAQVLSAAGDVHGDGRFLRGKVEAVHQVGADKAYGVVKVQADRKSTRLNSSHSDRSRMPSSA